MAPITCCGAREANHSYKYTRDNTPPSAFKLYYISLLVVVAIGDWCCDSSFWWFVSWRDILIHRSWSRFMYAQQSIGATAVARRIG